jgi:ATP-dependent RNA helicase DOB1
MSGRAGRRGKDDRGIVIQMLDERMDPAVCKDILYGAPDPLNSSYRISYNMLLNLMRVEDVDPEYLLRASFHQFQREQAAPALIAQAEELEAEAGRIDIGTPDLAELVSQYFLMDQQLIKTQRKLTNFIQKPEYVLKFLQSGRLINIAIGGEDFGWGVLVSYKKKQGRGSGGEAGRLASLSGGSDYLLDMLLGCVERVQVGTNQKHSEIESDSLSWRGTCDKFRPTNSKDEKKSVSWRVFSVGLEDIQKLSAIKLVLPQDCTTYEARSRVGSLLNAALKRFTDGLQLLDPVTDLGIQDDDFQTLLERATTLAKRLTSHKFTTDHPEVNRLVLVQSFKRRFELLEQSKHLREEARGCQTISMKDDLKKMKRVLKKLGHVDAMGVIQTKGRTACEVNTADELVVVELIFAGIFNDLSVEQSAALLSCLTFDERNKDDGDPASGLKPLLASPFYKLQEIARNVAKVKISCGIEMNEDEFVDKFNPGM